MVFDELFLDREERDRINIYSTLWEAPGHRLDIAATAITRGESYRQLRRRMEKNCRRLGHDAVRRCTITATRRW